MVDSLQKSVDQDWKRPRPQNIELKTVLNCVFAVALCIRFVDNVANPILNMLQKPWSRKFGIVFGVLGVVVLWVLEVVEPPVGAIRA